MELLVSNSRLTEITSSDSIASTASTLGIFLWDVLARVRGKANARPAAVHPRPFPLEGSRSRIPINDVQMTYSRRVSRKSKHEYDETDKTIPQKLVEDSIPRVHDRLPDSEWWSKFDEKLKKQETEKDLLSAREKLKLQNKTKTTTTKTVQKNVKLQKATELTKADNIKHSDPFSNRTKRSLSDHPELEGVLRRRQLYCRTGYHIQILSNGRVTGTDKDHDRFAILEFISVDVGLITIRGVESGKYLSMDSRGRLYGSETMTKESIFRETLQENWYNTYSSTKYQSHSNKRPCYVSLTKHGRVRHGCRSTANQRFTHFLPRPVDPEKVPNLYKGILY